MLELEQGRPHEHLCVFEVEEGAEKREEERERGTRGNCIADIVSHFTRDTTAAFISLPVPRNQNFNFLVSLESLPPAWEEQNSIYGNTKREET